MLSCWRCAAQGWDEELIQDALAAGRDAAREELDWEEAALADPTRRSLPGDSLRRYTPPRFASEVIQGIRQGAAKLFKARRCLLWLRQWLAACSAVSPVCDLPGPGHSYTSMTLPPQPV